MAGGTFDKTVGKIVPGTYINFEDSDTSVVSGGTRGTVYMPLANTDYGPAGVYISISAGSVDAAKQYLGYSIYDDDPANNMLLIREAFKNASTVIVYICTEGSAAATGSGGGLSATAKYKGARGNDLSYTVEENPLGGYDVTIYLDGSKMELFEGVESADDIESAYVTFTADGDLEEVAGVTLTGGTTATSTNADISAFLEAADGVRFNTMCFPFEDSTLCSACKTKIKYMRDSMGRGVQAVVPNFAADYEGIINVTNSYALEDGDLTTAQATAFVAGATAGAGNTASNTYITVDGATGVVGLKNYEETVSAVQSGEFFFAVSEAGNVIMYYDINSLVTFTTTKGQDYRKNRTIRVLDTFAESLQLNFPPNKYDNDADGWEIMEGIGKSILKAYGPRSGGGTGAITNIDYDSDFKVDQELSTGDETFIDVGIQPVDSAEKLYFTVKTR